MQKQISLLNFEDTEKAFAYKEEKDLKKARLLFWSMQFGFLVKMGSHITPFLIKYGFPVKNIIRNTLFKQFVGGESLEQTAKVCEKMDQYGVDIILDYGIEGGEYDNATYDKATEEFINVLSYAATRKNIPFISIKVTGLISISLLEKLNLKINNRDLGNFIVEIEKIITTLSLDKKTEWDNFLIRINRICRKAKETGIGVMIDAEESWIQDPIDYIAEKLMAEFNMGKALVYNTVQLYRKDRLAFLKYSYDQSQKNNYILGVKLVRGAYMEKEGKRAISIKYPNPIHPDKNATDNDYNEAVEFCLERIDMISTIIASHNEKSNLLAAEFMLNAGYEVNNKHVHFSQLYGMSDNLTFNLAFSGFNVSKYLPFGPVEEVIPYLMRRAQENSSISGQTSRELNLIKREYKRRGY